MFGQASGFLLAEISDAVSAVGIVYNSSMCLICVVRLSTIVLIVCLFVWNYSEKSDLLISVVNP